MPNEEIPEMSGQAQQAQPPKESVPIIEDAVLEKHLLLRGFVTRKHIQEARAIQEKRRSEGAETTLGEALLEKHFVTITQLKRLKAETESEGDDEPYPEIKGYEIIKKIRKGGMGTVYKARQISMDRVVALKILASELTDDETYVKRFLIEAKAVGKLNHENIVAGYDAGSHNGVYFFAMEYINGETILEIMRREKIVAVPFALNVAYQTSKALEHAAIHRIIHRDIKPGNIMINHHGTIKLCDLGFAKISSIDLLTKKGTTLGTPYYMSPEQCRGLPDIDTRSDIYSLGATLYHMLVGKVPFSGKTASEILKKHLTDSLVIPQERRAEMSEYLCHIIEKMMAKNREDRYENPTELLAELEPVIARYQSPKILMIHPSGHSGAEDLALLIATGAYEQGGKIEIVKAEDVKAEDLRQAGAIIIGSVDATSYVPMDIQGALEIMERFPEDMKGKLAAAFVAHEQGNLSSNAAQQMQIIVERMLNMGMMLRGSFTGVLGGQMFLEDPESSEGEKCRKIGCDMSSMLIYLTAGKQTMHRVPEPATSSIQEN